MLTTKLMKLIRKLLDKNKDKDTPEIRLLTLIYDNAIVLKE